MYIAVCDDDKDELLRISSILDSYRQERNAPVLYKIFQNPVDLISAAEDEPFTLYLLDVMMPGINGIKTASEIRRFDPDGKLVFLTSSPEFAFQSYSVKAYDYLLKPADSKKLFPLLDGLLAQLHKPVECIVLKTKSGMARISFSNLEYVEVMNKWVFFHMADGKVQEIAAPLAEFEPTLLSRPEFVRVHRSYIVNLWHVSSLLPGKLITLSGDSISVSRRLYPSVKDAYVEQSFNKGGE